MQIKNSWGATASKCLLASADLGNTQHRPCRQQLTVEFQTVGWNWSATTTGGSLGSAGPAASPAGSSASAAGPAMLLLILKSCQKMPELSKAEIQQFRGSGHKGWSWSVKKLWEISLTGLQQRQKQSFPQNLNKHPRAGWERMLISIW